MSATVHFFGIRHHGPGCARLLEAALVRLAPDCVLVEGPPEANELIPLVADPQLVPPVALLIYHPDQASDRVFYPFAEFSPEWRALRYAVARGVAVSFFDLGRQHQLGQAAEVLEATSADPFELLGEAAGFAGGEAWWDWAVEHNTRSEDVFLAVEEVMTELRDARGEPETLDREARREAAMRLQIRAALKRGYERIAVVCGAWHVPALRRKTSAKADQALLKGLPKVKTAATWAPWTHGRLATVSGYGAGVHSPGWYLHLWNDGRGLGSSGARWLTRVAHLLREQGLDCSSAHVIEACRLAGALAAMRDHHRPALQEMNEAAVTVMCFGDETRFELIANDLMIHEQLGAVPPSAPAPPLQRDLEALQKRLRLKPSADFTDLTLDLRKPMDRERSKMFHRLRLLGVAWAVPREVGGKKGSFHEGFRLQWQPEFAVALIEASVWGTHLEEAACHCAIHDGRQADGPAAVAELLDCVVMADLPVAVSALTEILNQKATLTGDVLQLLEGLPPLCDLLRFGDVRGTDTTLLEPVAEGMVARLGVRLTGAVGSLDDDAAERVYGLLTAVDRALDLLRNDAFLGLWRDALRPLTTLAGLHGLVAGGAVKLLLRELDGEETALLLARALSPGNPEEGAAAWVEGFLRDSGLVLVHDQRLWTLVNDWLIQLGDERFMAVLPLLRRTFEGFAVTERRALGQRAAKAATGAVGGGVAEASAAVLDARRGAKVLPVMAQLLGLEEVDS